MLARYDAIAVATLPQRDTRVAPDNRIALWRLRVRRHRQFQAANSSRRSRTRRISAIAPGCPISKTSRSIRLCSRPVHASVSYLRNWTNNGVLTTALRRFT